MTWEQNKLNEIIRRHVSRIVSGSSDVWVIKMFSYSRKILNESLKKKPSLIYNLYESSSLLSLFCLLVHAVDLFETFLQKFSNKISFHLTCNALSLQLMRLILSSSFWWQQFLIQSTSKLVKIRQYYLFDNFIFWKLT